MRILRVAQKLYPEVPGGGPYHVHALSRDQAAMGHDVTVLTVSRDEALPRRENRDGYSIKRHSPSLRIFGNDISVGLASELRRRSAYDVVHAHSHLYFSTNLAAIERKLTDVPLALTNHGLYSQTAPPWLFEWYLRTIGRWTFNGADLVFCYTEGDRTRLREFGVTAPIEVVPNGVDTQRFTPEGPRSQLIDHDGPVILFVGRLVEGKRPGIALEAFEELPQSLNAELYVAGDGSLRSDLEKRAGADVTFLGQVPYDEMPSVYRSGDVLILPSRAEGLPRTILEAFASETPVVASALPHIGDVVEHAGMTVERDVVEEYQAAVLRVFDRSQALGAKGRELVSERFRWDDTVMETTAALESISESGW